MVSGRFPERFFHEATNGATMPKILKDLFLGAIPDSMAWHANAKDIVAAIRKMLASAFWMALSLFVTTILAGLQTMATDHLGPLAAMIGIAAVFEGAAKLWARFVKDYSGIEPEQK